MSEYEGSFGKRGDVGAGVMDDLTQPGETVWKTLCWHGPEEPREFGAEISGDVDGRICSSSGHGDVGESRWFEVSVGGIVKVYVGVLYVVCTASDRTGQAIPPGAGVERNVRFVVGVVRAVE